MRFFLRSRFLIYIHNMVFFFYTSILRVIFPSDMPPFWPFVLCDVVNTIAAVASVDCG